MLVIGREIGQVITIGDDVRIRVIEVQGGIVRFGISAPRKVTVHRSEIHERIKLQGRRKTPA
ncbi:carbon storage regulator [Pseudomonas sp. NPDC089554]|uniref:carbon storage regulator n=1 Tax=Pseudomonas sp. NPDC089554 TaxID=3390653 RepID=UPI003D058A49